MSPPHTYLCSWVLLLVPNTPLIYLSATCWKRDGTIAGRETDSLYYEQDAFEGGLQNKAGSL